MNIAHFLRQSAIFFPERPALTWRGTTMSYRTFDQRASGFARWIDSLEFARDKRVVLFLDNCPDLLVAMFGTFMAGGAVLPANSRLTLDELQFLVSDGDACVIVTDLAHVDVARAVARLTDSCVVVAGEDLNILLNGILDKDASVYEIVVMDPSDTAWIFYTSGTTGQPKGALLPHSVLNFVTVSWLADLTPLSELDVTLHAAPLSHGAGFHALAATARGAHQVIFDEPTFDTQKVLQIISDFSVTNTWLVPTQIVMLTAKAAELGITGSDIASLQYVVYGGAPITPSALTRALDRFGSIFVQLLGQGETPMMISVLRRQDHVPELLGSAGRARPGIEVDIVGSNSESLPRGEVGELVVRGPSVMSGYLNRPEATAETIVDGWLHTGDLGRMTESGFIYLLDRAKDMIISGGSNVYAVEVEDILARHPLIREVSVVGIPDDLWGESVVGVVVVEGTESLNFEALALSLTELAREHLAGYKIPRRFIFRSNLPRNAYGKVLKRELRATITEEMNSDLEMQQKGRLS